MEAFQTLLLFHALRPDRVYFTPEEATADAQQTRRLAQVLPALHLVRSSETASDSVAAELAGDSDLKRAA